MEVASSLGLSLSESPKGQDTVTDLPCMQRGPPSENWAVESSRRPMWLRGQKFPDSSPAVPVSPSFLLREGPNSGSERFGKQLLRPLVHALCRHLLCLARGTQHKKTQVPLFREPTHSWGPRDNERQMSKIYKLEEQLVK